MLWYSPWQIGQYLIMVLVDLYKLKGRNKRRNGWMKEVSNERSKSQYLENSRHFCIEVTLPNIRQYMCSEPMFRTGASKAGLCNATTTSAHDRYPKTLIKKPAVIYVKKWIKEKQNALSVSDFLALRSKIALVTLPIQCRDTMAKAILIKDRMNKDLFNVSGILSIIIMTEIMVPGIAGMVLEREL